MPIHTLNFKLVAIIPLAFEAGGHYNPWTFILANLLLELYTYAKSPHLLAYC